MHLNTVQEIERALADHKVGDTQPLWSRGGPRNDPPRERGLLIG